MFNWYFRQYSEKLTTSNFDDVVKKHVDSGKTFFVRWIASEGWGWWRKQAPAWNSIVKRFASNNDVAFGDVNLSQERITGDHNPGSGGWPTIRYFNKETGYEGASYKQKTSKAICDELGDESNMEAYVLEYGNICSCSIVNHEGCSDKEVEYKERLQTMGTEEINAQLSRLSNTKSAKMKEAAKAWIRQRICILKQLLTSAAAEPKASATVDEL